MSRLGYSENVCNLCMYFIFIYASVRMRVHCRAMNFDKWSIVRSLMNHFMSYRRVYFYMDLIYAFDVYFVVWN